MAEEVMIEYFLYLITGMVGFVLMRVWKIPAIENKLDNVVRETEVNRNKIHNINNTLYQHETRITLLEKSEEKAREPQATSKGASRGSSQS